MTVDLSQYHYAPILKWKAGEYRGLSDVSPVKKRHTAPIFLMPPNGSFDNDEGKVLSPDEHIKSFGSRVASAWSGRLCFLDAGQIDTPEYWSAAGGSHPLLALIERSSLYNLRALCAPATSLSMLSEYQLAVRRIHQKDARLPVCVRVYAEELDDPKLKSSIENLLATINCQPNEVLLVLDAANLSYENPVELAAMLTHGVNSLPFLHKWAALAISLCSLPSKPVTPPNQVTEFARDDWLVYATMREHYLNRDLIRMPIFSDYGTENTDFGPSKPVWPATQLRYSTDKSLFVFKGQNTKVGGYKGIFPVAKRLTKHSCFSGRRFSHGDAQIADLAQRSERPGNASNWKQYGITHHLALVHEQVAKLIGVSLVEQDAISSDENQQGNLFDAFS